MYTSIGDDYRQRFGCRVVKIPVGVVDDCPNRRGLKGMQTCTYCDVWGSAAKESILTMPLSDQIAEVCRTKRAAHPDSKFLIYFQSYTTTFAAVDKLRREFDIALSHPDVCGIVVGTRPDCLSARLLALWNEYKQRTALFVELGVESFDEQQLLFMRRGHTAKQSREAIQIIHEHCPDLPIGIHLIFGLPGEQDPDVLATAREVARLPLHSVKLHHLHVLRGTHLEQLYNEGLFRPVDLQTYARRVVMFLRHIPSHIAVHRLAGLSSRWDDVIAPEWTRHKMRPYQYILESLRQAGAVQGDRCDLMSRPSMRIS